MAAIIIGAVIRLIDFKYPFELLSYKLDDLFMLLITFMVTLTIGISEGILVGILISIVFLIYRSTKPHVAECVQIEGTNQYRNKTRFENTKERADVLIFRFDGQLYFANCQYFKECLKEMTTNKGADNITGAQYDAFEQVMFAPSGISFSINNDGNLIATI